MDADNTRRRFLLSSALGLSSAWLAWPAIVAAQQHSHRSGKSGQSASFEFFAPQDALEIEAVAAQIIPSDDAPGAREARVIYFIDRALMTFDVDKQLAYTQGLEDLQQKTLELFPVADGFSSRSSAQQIQLLTGIEHSGFFELVRLHTIMGYLSHPDYGGNHNQAGWKLIGFEDKMTYAPPFGYYDTEYNKRR
jgi:gluconate 2-dehydrogenase gamma chain